ncbi:hypothetical protein GCM10009416_38870 [Craurococcus roseus]|uniref:Uncharacterized protein n=1 Tax=Craurococcus roseus TaxID=77585 RepID=A0ABP3QST9_9PROT
MSDAASPTAAQRAAGAGAVRRAPPKRRPSPAGAGAASRGARGKGRGPARFPAAFRWVRVLLLVAAVVVGLPLAHAMFGEVVALLGGACLLGFLLGRWTAPGG